MGCDEYFSFPDIFFTFFCLMFLIQIRSFLFQTIRQMRLIDGLDVDTDYVVKKEVKTEPNLEK